MRALTATALALVLVVPAARAQGNCYPATDSREADLFAHFAVPLAYAPAQAPWIYRAGSVQFGLEAALLPDASDRMATPTTCRPGKGPENVNLLPGLLRPRLAYALPEGVLLEAAWIPPVRLTEVKANFVSVALSRSLPLGDAGTLFTGRLHATIGSMHAPITCPDDALADTLSECYQGTRSNDRFSPNIFGAELAFTFPRANGRFRPYLGAGYSILHPRFQVHFRNAQGTLDRRKVEVNLRRVAVFGGATLAVSPDFLLSGEVYSTPLDQVTARVRMTVVTGGNRR